MLRMLGIGLSMALASTLLPQSSETAEAGQKVKAQRRGEVRARVTAGGTDVNRLGNRSIDAGLYGSDGLFVPKRSKNRKAKDSGK